ncbi:MAG: CDP-alcohol phosphatidyltransferase family protein [Prevotella sp.]|jgi:phosphatidylglycerophosphate synthase|nr:CDP-alcohol phosphatidyltransferase family protein [Prevotella sp.]
MENQQTPTLESTLKSSDTEEFIDIHFYRPIGYCWARLFRRTGVTPNTVTIASIFLGIGAGLCFYFDSLWITLLGIFLLVWANSFDSADGQLARMTKQFSALGRMLDGFAGDMWFASIYIAICFRLAPEWGWPIWALAIFAGYFHSKQAAMADYYRNIHLLFLKGVSGSELDNSADLKAKAKALSWKEQFVPKLFLFFYLPYTKGQEDWSPDFQRLAKLLAKKYAAVAPPDTFRADFRAKSLPLMKWTNILSFNTRAIVLFLSLLVKAPWFYFAFELIVLNVILFYMIRTHERFCRDFVEKLSSCNDNHLVTQSPNNL